MNYPVSATLEFYCQAPQLNNYDVVRSFIIRQAPRPIYYHVARLFLSDRHHG